MQVDEACIYLGQLSQEAFFQSVLPALSPIRLADGVVRYDRKQIDAFVDSAGTATPRRADADWLKDIVDAED